MTNSSTPNSKKNKLQTRIFTPKLTESDTIAFTFLAAEQGLTPDKLIESFVNDIVSSFCNDEITEEKKHLSDWFNGSWFSKDNDGYFSFLQYIICNKSYPYISAALSEIKLCNIEIAKHKNVELNLKLKATRKETIKKCFKEYCIKNPAHKSLKVEIKMIADFDNNIDKISKGGKCKWH